MPSEDNKFKAERGVRIEMYSDKTMREHLSDEDFKIWTEYKSNQK